ncbi:hypothetical protein D3C76_795060 [compost metagenome]
MTVSFTAYEVFGAQAPLEAALAGKTAKNVDRNTVKTTKRDTVLKETFLRVIFIPPFI